jgi:hypothetical protein
MLIPATSIIFLFSSFSGNYLRYPGGSPGGYTGSPGDGKDCTQCHGGTASPVIGWITSDVPDDGYMPGETYTITVTVSGSGDKGFEVSPQDLEGNLIGSLIPGSGNKLVGGNTAVTQSSSSSANPKIWQFQWVAPSSGVGDVTFYGAFTVNKPVTKTSTLTLQENTGVYISENTPISLKIFPNPVKDHMLMELHRDNATFESIRILNAAGAVVYYESINLQAGKNIIHIQLPDIRPGIYFYMLQSEGRELSGKILIVN